MKKQLSPKLIVGVFVSAAIVLAAVSVSILRQPHAATYDGNKSQAGPGNGIPAAMEPTGTNTFTPR